MLSRAGGLNTGAASDSSVMADVASVMVVFASGYRSAASTARAPDATAAGGGGGGSGASVAFTASRRRARSRSASGWTSPGRAPAIHVLTARQSRSTGQGAPMAAESAAAAASSPTPFTASSTGMRAPTPRSAATRAARRGDATGASAGAARRAARRAAAGAWRGEPVSGRGGAATGREGVFAVELVVVELVELVVFAGSGSGAAG